MNQHKLRQLVDEHIDNYAPVIYHARRISFKKLRPPRHPGWRWDVVAWDGFAFWHEKNCLSRMDARIAKNLMEQSGWVRVKIWDTHRKAWVR